MIEIKEITMNQLEDAHWLLILDADPAKEVVEKYLSRSRIFVAERQSQVVGILLLLPTRPEIVEIINLAVAEEFRGQGIATKLIHHVIELAKQENYQQIEVGTGSTGVEQLYLYQKCGFRMSHIEQDFFVSHYSEEIIENGLVLKDMVRLNQTL
ncbi:ribosomal protein S18 acetylase RimI-like enzyme [Enterococcus sp. PF1-24]|uniref:GNAT family N-acetyltransferase n=1 Tax=unclassified Enterococcus TaxID=2608891 RepID=UPI0024742619|nr:MULTISPECIES: GNAT family N-acetyltransferase [unclassified Enterococcus]MDH6365186.1 ribosomal protein S18 acetylase RimI-like enzyme [Enterococcus sp. PFB1-1]MDH6402287.1 ribosomal protein S18 acetylase RimI-like enzyme [Enterococcus sp. PF1-24]